MVLEKISITKLLDEIQVKDVKQEINLRRDEIKKSIIYHFGEDYKDFSINSFQPKIEQLKSFQCLKSQDILRKSYFFWSNRNRTGKSAYLAMIYASIVSQYGFGCTRIFSDSELQSQCRHSWLDNNPYFMKESYKTDKFYIFKDFGKATINKDESQVYLFDFMDFLFSNCPPKILYFASNFSPKMLSQLPGRNWEDIAARINEKCEIIEV